MVRHLTFANVCSALALAVALGTGGAYAANTVRSKDIVDGQVKSVDLRKNAVRAKTIKAGSVDGSKVADGSLTSAELAFDAVHGSQVVDDSLTFDDIVGAVSTGSLNFSAGFVANGRCRDFNATVSGARPGEAVVLSLRGDLPQGITLVGVGVEVADLVRAKVCNLSGTTMDQVTDLPVRIVTFR